MSLIFRVLPSEKVNARLLEQSSTTTARTVLKSMRPDDFGQRAYDQLNTPSSMVMLQVSPLKNAQMPLNTSTTKKTPTAVKMGSRVKTNKAASTAANPVANIA